MTIERRVRRYFLIAIFCVDISSGIIIGLVFPQMFQPLSVIQIIIGAMCCLLVGVAAAYGLAKYVAATIAVPLKNITDIAMQVVAGTINTPVPIDSNIPSELRIAGETLNALAEKATKDIKDMKRLERVRSEFLGNVSHELRTPIFSIQGYLETLLDGAIDDETVRRQFLSRAYSNSLRINTLLADLIDISKIESGEMRLSFRYFNVCDVIQDVVNSLEIQTKQKNIELRNNTPSTAVTVYGDKERIAQVMTNLIENAIKYNVENGMISINVFPRANDVKIEVSDTGIGIAKEHHARIFERFYRVDKDRSRAVGGTGLGLAIVKHILEAHQTLPELQSEPGKGTTVSFTLKKYI